MTYREDLPNNCPPEDAAPLDETAYFFRLVDQYPPAEGDFDSVWKTQPGRHERLPDECIAKGVSLFDNPRALEARTRQGNFSDKVTCLVRVTPESGPVRQGTSHHHTWWPFRDYDIPVNCSEYNP